MEAQALVEELAGRLGLNELLTALRRRFGTYQLLEHWQQGEFHHDLLVRAEGLDGVLVVATNCNGGIKEILLLADTPERWALWNWRCPDNPEFEGEIPELLARTVTAHYFDPGELLREDARSEIKPEFRERMRGGGWRLRRDREADQPTEAG